MKNRGMLQQLVTLALAMALVATNAYWYILWLQASSKPTTSTENVEELRMMLARVSKENQRLLENMTVLESKYQKLWRSYEELRAKIIESKQLAMNIALLDSLTQLNESIKQLILETTARTSIGNYTKNFFTPPQMMDRVLMITGSLYREEKAVTDIMEIYQWVQDNIASVQDQPTLRIRVLYLRVSGKSFPAQIDFSYTNQFVQTDVETLERGAGDILDKTILLVSMLQAYLGAKGKSYLLYCQMPIAPIYAAVVHIKGNNTYLILDLLTGAFGPSSDITVVIHKWIDSYGVPEKDIIKAKLVNDKSYMEGSLDDVISYLKGEA